MPEGDVELIAKVDRLQDGLGRLIELVGRQAMQISEVRADLKAVNARLDAQPAWLQSTGRRFIAIMAPCQQNATLPNA